MVRRAFSIRFLSLHLCGKPCTIAELVWPKTTRACSKLSDVAPGHEYDNCTAAARFVTWHAVPARPAQPGDPSGPPTPLSSSAPASTNPEKLRKAMGAIPGDACASHVWWAVAPGLARVSAVLELEPKEELRREMQERGGDILPESAPRKLATEWVVSVYSPLVLERADNGTGVGGYTVPRGEVIHEVKLPPGSTVKVRTKGGPERRGSEAFAEGARVSGDGVTVQQIGPSDAGGSRTYEVTCSKLGTQVRGWLWRRMLVGICVKFRQCNDPVSDGLLLLKMFAYEMYD